jgi:hypothetical protein
MLMVVAGMVVRDAKGRKALHVLTFVVGFVAFIAVSEPT